MVRKKSGEQVADSAATSRKPTPRRRATAARKRPTRAETNAPMPHSETQIRERAYYIYLERRDVPGDPVGDWYQAERELRPGSPAAVRQPRRTL